MQRLFSTFADGWPGVGLLLQRVLVAILLVHFGTELTGTSFSPTLISQIIGVCAGIFLLIGLWTPIVGTLTAIIEVWAVVTHINEPWIPMVIATLAGTAAMIGPGAWSIDARLFGRKHIGT